MTRRRSRKPSQASTPLNCSPLSPSAPPAGGIELSSTALNAVGEKIAAAKGAAAPSGDTPAVSPEPQPAVSPEPELPAANSQNPYRGSGRAAASNEHPAEPSADASNRLTDLEARLARAEAANERLEAERQDAVARAQQLEADQQAAEQRRQVMATFSAVEAKARPLSAAGGKLTPAGRKYLFGDSTLEAAAEGLTLEDLTEKVERAEAIVAFLTDFGAPAYPSLDADSVEPVPSSRPDEPAETPKSRLKSAASGAIQKMGHRKAA